MARALGFDRVGAMRKARRPAVAIALASVLGAAAIGCATTSSSSTATSARPATTTQKPSLAQRAVTRVEDVTGTLGGDDDEPKDDAKRESVPIAGTDLVRGRSTVTVKAPIEKVRAAVLGFSHYAEFMPHYKNAKLLGKTPNGGRDVYMEIEALHGAVTMWARIEVPKPTIDENGVETYATTFIKGGNVKDFQAIWRMKKLDEGHTELSLEVFLQPSITLPAELQNDENVEGSAKGVLAMRDRAERP
jgi:hypothetical protein